MPKVLAIIPARGGSKGILRKNISPLLGKPLIYYTIIEARKSTTVSRLILSSEDVEIQGLCKSMGVEVPFHRPAHLATDRASSLDVALHALGHVEESSAIRYDLILLLQPTSPLRTCSDIDLAVQTLINSDADAIVSVTKIQEPHPYKMVVIDNNRNLRPLLAQFWTEGARRQDLPDIYVPNGAIYCVRRRVLKEQRSLWGRKTLPFLMNEEKSININSHFDLKFAEFLIRQKT